MSRDGTLIKYTTFKHFMGSDYEITQKINLIKNTNVDRSRKGESSIISARTSMKRAHKKLFEVLRSNEWKYFVTLTFDNIDYFILSALSVKSLNFLSIYYYVCIQMDDSSFLTKLYLRDRLHILRKKGYIVKSGTHYSVTERGKVNTVDRLNDEACRKKFTEWSKFVHERFPNMKYVAVPEYHKIGGLHYHIVMGNIDANDLGLVDSGRVLHHGRSWSKQDFIDSGFELNVSNGEGMPIFNVNCWDHGFSTATEIRCSDAVAKYVGKYLSKADIDPRFYNKKRYHCSMTVTKPLVHTYKSYLRRQDYDPCLREYLEEDGLYPVFEDEDKQFISYALAEPDQEGKLLDRCFGIVPPQDSRILP